MATITTRDSRDIGEDTHVLSPNLLALRPRSERPLQAEGQAAAERSECPCDCPCEPDCCGGNCPV